MPKIIVVGGGLAGLMATIKVCEAGHEVDLISLVPVRRSHSVCAQGGINGAVNTKGEGDSPWIHFDDTVYGGDFLADQPPVKAMCEAAPGIIYLFDRMGVPFNRTPEGLIDFRRFGGTMHHRTAFSGGSTGQQLLYALDEQVRRYEVEGKVTKYEGWDFTGLIMYEGRVAGCTAQNLHTMEFKSFKSDVVVMATGGIGMIYGKSTNSVINTGSAAAHVYKEGAIYANPEMIQVHPTAIPGDDKLRLMSESIRGEGGRVWVYKDGKPFYFLEEKYPKYGNLVPRDVATREIFDICVNQGLGIDGKNQVFLDVSHIPAETLERKIGNLIKMYRKFAGDDATKVPMRIFPGVHYSMGGLYAGYEKKENGDLDASSPKTMMTNIPGLYAIGEANSQYHGANRLGANSLLSCVYDGMICGPATLKYIKGLNVTHAEALPESVFENAVKEAEAKYAAILKMDGPENPYRLADELGKSMTQNVTVVRFNKGIEQTLDKIAELKERYKKIGVPDTSSHSNQPAVFTRWLDGMLVLAEAIARGALMRDESRGAHYKPDFPERDDDKYLKHTMATYSPDGPKFEYRAVDVTHIKPRKRDYSKS